MSKKNVMPVLPLRDIVVYPHMVIPLFVGRKKSINALDIAYSEGKKILLVAQKQASEDEPDIDGIYHVGTVATILQLLKLPDGTIKLLVEGEYRARIVEFEDNDEYFSAVIYKINSTKLSARESEVLSKSVMSQFEQYVKLEKKVPFEVISSMQSITDTEKLVDTVSAHLTVKISEKQKILELNDERERIEHLMTLLESEIDLLQVEKKIRSNVKKQMEKTQREYYLNEQKRAIQKELGEITDGGVSETESFTQNIEESGMTKEAKKKALAEVKRLESMPSMSAEATVCRNYLEWMLQVPWGQSSKVKIDLENAQKILDEDHYGLEKVKERIIEYLAVQKRVKKLKGPVLCLVGPPGVGKTSLAESIAKATKRKFLRMALGGVKDEAEIRGHRKTYIGAMPGKIIQKLAKAEVKNPLFLLDEVDKMAMDYRGDPASALLEVLDPEQNSTFNDNFLEVDYDLSEVMFVATSNSLDMPGPLLDRMEVIMLSGYTENEKLSIASNYLLPKQIKRNGLKNNEIKVTKEALLDVIRYYTREAGVRGLEREISKICRKVIKKLLTDNSKKTYSISEKELEEFLGIKKYRYGEIEEENKIGQVVGLAWTQVGGEILNIEAVGSPGKGKLIKTGKLGDVMQESIQAATTVVRSRAKEFNIPEDFHEKVDIHIHVPEGATPKDGPSAGIGMCTAMVSMLTKIPVKRTVAMTGEITLSGQVLPIGGLKEKLLAAKRAGILDAIIPEENMKDLKEISDEVYSGVNIHPVRYINEVISIALEKNP